MRLPGSSNGSAAPAASRAAESRHHFLGSSPAYVDIAKGAEKFAKDNPDKAEIVETIFTEVQPTDLTTPGWPPDPQGVPSISDQHGRGCGDQACAAGARQGRYSDHDEFA